MFTVKHYQSNGIHSVYSCDYYNYSPPTENPVNDDQGPLTKPSLALYEKRAVEDGPQSAKHCISLFEGDNVYIENASGHTIDVIRPVKLIDN